MNKIVAVCTGKESKYRDYNVGEGVIMSLTESLICSQVIIYADNLFMSARLVHELYVLGKRLK